MNEISEFTSQPRFTLAEHTPEQYRVFDRQLDGYRRFQDWTLDTDCETAVARVRELNETVGWEL